VDDERRALIRARLKKAERKLLAGRSDLDAGRFEEAASRAYYVMFHAARALLAAQGISARTHSGLAAVFAEHFVRPGEVNVELGRWLGQGRRAREVGDYDDFLTIEQDEAAQAVDRAGRFLEAARGWLMRQGYAEEAGSG
jgi:uncharacterized protein (UPF0332 family)